MREHRRTPAQSDDTAARARRLEILRGLAEHAEPTPAPAPPQPSTRLEAELAGAAPPRARRWPVIAGIIAAALVIVVIGPSIVLLHLHSPAARATPIAQLTSILAPQLASTTIYVVAAGTAVSHIYALNAQTGAVRWRFPFAGSKGAPILAGGVLYAGSNDGLVYALDPTTGKQRWAANLGAHNGAYLTVATGRVLVADGFDFVYALDAASGKQVWRHEGDFNGIASASAPAVANGLVYVASGDYPTGRGALTAFDSASGAVRWRAMTGFAASGAPVVTGGLVYMTANDGTIWAFRAASGMKVWSRRLNTAFDGGVIIAGNLLYAEGQDGTLYALNPATGAQVWRVVEQDSTGEASHVTPLAANGAVYVGSRDGLLYAFDAHGGALIWRYQASDPFTSSPALLDGALYVCNDTSGLLALRAADGALAWNVPLDGSAVTLAVALP